MSVSYTLRDLESCVYEEERVLSTAIGSIAESNASLEKPQLIGQYMLFQDKASGRREPIFAESKLKYSYLHLPSKLEHVAYDLSAGYNKNINWSSAANVKLDEFLQWILRNRHKLPQSSNPAEKPLGTDFVTWRGVLTKLMVSSFVKDKWLVGATMFKGTIYLCPYYDTEESVNDYGNLFSYGGHRFENYITRTEPKKVQCDHFDAATKEEYSVVIKSKVQSSSGKISLLYAAEIDCLDTGKTQRDAADMENFVEIKTTRRMHHENQYRNFCKFKLIKWWAQSYLVGVPKIICGYKNDRHIVDSIEEMNVHRIPSQCSEFWSRRQCMNFLQQFLSFVQHIVTDDDPYRVYLFSNEVPNMISTRKLLNRSHFQILPEWYISELTKCTTKE